MAVSNTTGFNAIQDGVFRDLVSNFTISAQNPLRDCLPSQLNLTHDCLATGDAFYLLNDTRRWNSDPTGLAKDVAASLRPALPGRFANITSGSFYLTEYAFHVATIPESFYVLWSTWRNVCLQRTAPLIPLDLVDFNKDCALTNNYWWRSVYGHKATTVGSESFLSLIRRSLPDALKTLTNETLIQGLNLTKASDVDRIVTTAAVKCKAEACQALKYTGSADIGGIGTLIVYTIIAVFSAVSCLIGTLNAPSFVHRPVQIVPRSRLSKALFDSSAAFAETAVFFAIMVTVATLIYQKHFTSLYEMAVADIVSLMVFNANLCLIIFVLIRDGRGSSLQIYSQAVAYMVSCFLLTAMRVAFRDRKLRANAMMYLDLPCYVDNIWPATYINILNVAELGLYGVIVLTLFLNICRRCRFTAWPSEKLFPLAMSFVRLGAFLLMFCDLIAVYYIRVRARKAFGASYGDDRFGFGQITAIGFVLQTVLVFTYLLSTAGKRALADHSGPTVPTPPDGTNGRDSHDANTAQDGSSNDDIAMTPLLPRAHTVPLALQADRSSAAPSRYSF